jgi:sugar/nucleoside kinase (ribokinase family)
MTGDQRDIDLLVIGDCCPDIVLSGDRVRPSFGQAETLVAGCQVTIGGSGAITACRAAELGASVALVTVLGNDVFAGYLRDRVASYGVDVSGVRVDPTCSSGLTVVLSEPSDRAMLTWLGTLERLVPEDVPPGLLARARHVHVSSYFLQRGLHGRLAELLSGLRGAGVTTSLDTNWDPTERWLVAPGVLPAVDVLCVNEAEAVRLAGGRPAAAAAQYLSDQVEVVLVKRGAQPALAVSRGRLWCATPPSLETGAVVDTVGAGDSFDAGFLSEWISGRSISRALSLACAVGSLSTLRGGGTTEAVDPGRAREWARRVTVSETTCSDSTEGLGDTQ